jgi:hypothetical protein
MTIPMTSGKGTRFGVSGGKCPDRQLHFEVVHALSTELCYERTVGPAQDQQVCVAFQIVAERQQEPILPVYALMLHQQKPNN